jgi:Ino eighty subunit 1
MAASISPPAGGMSDIEQPSSPVRHGHEHSFITNLTEDEDTKMMDGTPDPSEGPNRRRRTGRDSSAPNNNGSNVGKVKHLKKEDGEPLWRKDIQYDFLKAVFDNDKKVFTNSYEPDLPKQCFADLYIDTMSRSSKTSKVLRDKLLSDREAAKGMAMVCLLVNIGRMNTTLNCEYKEYAMYDDSSK